MNGMTHVYSWGNNPVRAEWRGHRCQILACLKMGSVYIEREDGQRMVTSRRALRRITEPADATAQAIRQENDHGKAL